MSTETVKRDFMASIVVFLVALPLCMGIAIASGVPVAAGLITGIVGGLVVGMIAGCPLQVSGPAAGLTVIIYDVVQEHGLETLGVVVLLAGLIQVVAGLLHLGQWFRAVSPAVIKGMLAGIGVLIFASQFHVMVDDKPKGSGLENLITIPQAITKASTLPEMRSVESRQFHRSMLQRVGELHRRQVELHERISEKFPHDHVLGHTFQDEKSTADAEVLEQFITMQHEIDDELKVVVKELDEVEDHISSKPRAEAILTTAHESQGRTTEAISSLTNRHPEEFVVAQHDAERSLQELLNRLKNHDVAAHLGLLAIGMILIWQIMPRKIRVIPGPLVAVVVTTVVAAWLSLPVFYVEIPDQLWEGVHFPSMVVLQELKFSILLQLGLLIAIVASAETLLCATAVDQLHDGERTNYDRELFAQGVGNTVCGILGVLPMTGVIVRSSANIQAGGKTKLSAILHGIWLLIFVAALGFLLRQIPTACLAAILVYTGLKLVNIKAIRGLARYGKSEVAIYAATVATIVSTDLLTGVITGIVLAALKLLYTFSRLETELTIDKKTNIALLRLRGAATFIRLPAIASELEDIPRGSEVHVDFHRLDYIDHACLELLMTWAKQHEHTGGKFVIDWESLHDRFHHSGESRQNSLDKSESPQEAQQLS